MNDLIKMTALLKMMVNGEPVTFSIKGENVIMENWEEEFDADWFVEKINRDNSIGVITEAGFSLGGISLDCFNIQF